MDQWLNWAQDMGAKAFQFVISVDFLAQIAAIALAAMLGWVLVKPAKSLTARLKPFAPKSWAAAIEAIEAAIMWPLVTALALGLAQIILTGIGRPVYLPNAAASLALAVAAIRLLAMFIKEPFWARVAIWIASFIAALNAFGLLNSVISALDAAAVPFGAKRISVLFVLNAVALSVLLIWGATNLAEILRRRIDALPSIEPSLRILLAHATRLALFVLAAILLLTGLDIDLSALALLGGALGVGVGFGMQHIVANFISGIIVLTDRSIKPNDLIAVGDDMGEVKSLGLRYAVIHTRDGKDILVPNEKFITDSVVSWSHSDLRARVRKMLRIDHDADLALAVDLAEAATKMIDGVLDDPAPECFVREFGQEQFELEIVFWVPDGNIDLDRIASKVLLAIWKEWRAAGIDVGERVKDIAIVSGAPSR